LLQHISTTKMDAEHISNTRLEAKKNKKCRKNKIHAKSSAARTCQIAQSAVHVITIGIRVPVRHDIA